MQLVKCGMIIFSSHAHPFPAAKHNLDSNPFSTRAYSDRQIAEWQASIIAWIDNPLATLDEITSAPSSPTATSPLRNFPPTSPASTTAENPAVPHAMDIPPPAPAFYNSSGSSSTIPKLYNTEATALGEFRRAWTSYLLRSCANLGTRDSVTSLPVVPEYAQYILIQDCFAQGSSAAAWLDSLRAEFEGEDKILNCMDLLWAALTRDAARVTRDQLFRYQTLAMAPGEGTAAFGQRIIATWNGVKAQEPEAHAIELFLDGIKASDNLHFASHVCKAENRTIVKVVAMAVDVQLQEGISRTAAPS